MTPKPLRSRANAIINLMGAVGGILYLGLAALNIGTVLPLGISYYIFKIISYEVDVCTGKIAPEKNFITFAVYVLFFPQLIVGPIVKYREMADQLHDGANRCTPARAEHGAELFVFGLAKKVILADSIGALWTDIIGAGGVGLTNVSTPLAWLGIIAYSLQLYFDFAGYSEMSNGLAALLGFDCPANFNLPYISGSITEFWRRWHITLSGWFRDYIYIPLGGNRKGQARQLLNMFLVWAATGIWHGASWNFLLWGLYFAAFLILEKLWLRAMLERLPAILRHIYVLLVVGIGWVLFRADTMAAAAGFLGDMFSLTLMGTHERELAELLCGGKFLLQFAVSVLFCTPVFTRLHDSLEERRLGGIGDGIVLLFFMLAVCEMMASGYNPFIYFRF